MKLPVPPQVCSPTFDLCSSSMQSHITSHKQFALTIIMIIIYSCDKIEVHMMYIYRIAPELMNLMQVYFVVPFYS
jgi:hypothetical protein